MKVKNKLEIAAILPVILAIMVSVVLFRASESASKLDEIQSTADALVKAVFKLNLATYACLTRGDAEDKENWQARHDTIGQLLNKERHADPDDRGIIADMRKDQIGMAAAFLSLVNNREQVPHASAGDEALHNLWATSQSMMESALALAQIGRINAASLQKTAHMLIVGMTVVLAVALAGLALFIGLKVSKGIAVLHEGTLSVSKGDLDRKIEYGSNDELGGLAAAFNEMTEQLKASMLALEAEIIGHKKTAQALQESNESLKDALEKLQKAQQQAIQQERMQALRQMARGIVHNLNNALAPIVSMSELMLTYPKALADRDEAVKNVQMISDAARAAAATVQNLSEFFRPGKDMPMEDLRVNELAQYVIDMTKPRWKEHAEADGITIYVAADLGKDLPTIRGNKAKLQEALTNLILNAIDALPKGGKISLRTGVEGADALIEIKDSGDGMSAEVCSKCFEPFFSTKGSGFPGMGLTATKGIVEQHGGTIEIESEPGKGATVKIRIPKVESNLPEEQAARPAAAPRSKLRILVADDEEWIRSILKQCLAVEGHIVEVASNGREAMEIFAPDRFDLVMLDRAMPRMSGDQLAAEIKRVASRMPVIMLTGFGDMAGAKGKNPPNVDLVLGKPFTQEDIRSAIAKVV